KYQFPKSEIPKFAVQIADEIYQFYINPDSDPDSAEFVRDLVLCPFHEIELVYNPGGYMISRIINDHIEELVEKKEALLNNYYNSRCTEYWLLIIATNTSPDSFGIDENCMHHLSINTKFDRLYILEHFKNKLYRIV